MHSPPRTTPRREERRGPVDRRRQLDPVRGSRGRSELLPVRDRARYYINIDNNGDGKADVRYRFKFKTTYKNPNSFLYAAPPVTSLDDPQLFVAQTYDIVPGGSGKAHSSSRKGKKHRSNRKQEPSWQAPPRQAQQHARSADRQRLPGRAEQRRTQDDA